MRTFRGEALAGRKRRAAIEGIERSGWIIVDRAPIAEIRKSHLGLGTGRCQLRLPLINAIVVGVDVLRTNGDRKNRQEPQNRRRWRRDRWQSGLGYRMGRRGRGGGCSALLWFDLGMGLEDESGHTVHRLVLSDRYDAFTHPRPLPNRLAAPTAHCHCPLHTRRRGRFRRSNEQLAVLFSG